MNLYASVTTYNGSCLPCGYHSLEPPLVMEEKYIVVMVTAVAGHDSDSVMSPHRLLRRRTTGEMALSSGWIIHDTGVFSNSLGRVASASLRQPLAPSSWHQLQQQQQLWSQSSQHTIAIYTTQINVTIRSLSGNFNIVFICCPSWPWPWPTLHLHFATLNMYYMQFRSCIIKQVTYIDGQKSWPCDLDLPFKAFLE